LKRHLFSVAFLLLALAFLAAAAHRTAPVPSAEARPGTVRTNADALPPGGAPLLFPGLDAAAVTSVSITADGRSFEFLRRDAGSVSVNGSRADAEAFRTLIAQIAEITVAPAPSPPEGGQPLLHLTVTAGGAQYRASFFGGGSSPRALVRSDSHSGWHHTEGWRVGTLMLACEGARIEDML